MSGVGREEGFLKLVYPKGRVELHKHPITAAEVLKRNPRFCVTRPDVFKYPWIVVRPESVLSLNRVFFVVPLHTIHRLLKEHGVSPLKQSYLLQQQQPPNENALVLNSVESRQSTLPGRKTCRSEEYLDGSLSETEYSEIHLSKNRTYIVDHQCKPLIEPTGFHRLVRRQNEAASQKNVNHEPKEDGDKRYESRMRTPNDQCNDHKIHKKQVGKEPQKKQYPMEHWPKNLATKKHHQELLQRHDSGCGSFRRNKGALEAKCAEQASKLKPCLKKNSSNGPRSRGLNVTFDIPGDDDKKWKLKVYDPRESFGFLEFKDSL